MKRNLILLWLMLAAMTVSAQRSMTHRVQRGETAASIAHKYGMTEDELYRRNPNVRNYYAGTYINVVDYYDDSGSNSNMSLSEAYGNPDLAEAQNYERTGDYKKAIKSYSRVIKVNPTASNYYSRGLCYYQTKKWKKAISDFEYVIDAPDCSRMMRRECARYLDDAYERAAIAKEKRTNVIAGILAGVVAVGVAADALSSSSKKHDKGKPAGKPATKQGGQPQQGGKVTKQDVQRQSGGSGQGGKRPQGGRRPNRGTRSNGAGSPKG
ncbi:MAG: tetratricopeptide repeat protein [Prevotella sp.]|nr:tetratricopeptide repeat protein [Prevotella sp.]